MKIKPGQVWRHLDINDILIVNPEGFLDCIKKKYHGNLMGISIGDYRDAHGYAPDACKDIEKYPHDWQKIANSLEEYYTRSLKKEHYSTGEEV